MTASWKLQLFTRKKPSGSQKNTDTPEYFCPNDHESLLSVAGYSKETNEAIKEVKDVEKIIAGRKKTLPDNQRGFFPFNPGIGLRRDKAI